MEENKIKKIYEILDSIMITEENADLMEEIRNDLMNKNYILALKKMEKLNMSVLKFPLLNNLLKTWE